MRDWTDFIPIFVGYQCITTFWDPFADEMEPRVGGREIDAILAPKALLICPKIADLETARLCYLAHGLDEWVV